MPTNSTMPFELTMMHLLGLPQGTTRFTLECSTSAVPMVHCEYEIFDRGDPTVRDGIVKTLKESYEIKLIKKEKIDG